MYTLRLKSEENKMTLRKTENTFQLQQVGRRGLQGIPGEPGTPGEVLVSSVAGKQGVVTLEPADVGLPNVDDTADLDKPVSSPVQDALDQKQYKMSVVVGVNGDFVTDGTNDQVQINAAVQFIKSMSATGYGTVELPDPQYNIGGGITLEDGIWFNGGGMYQTVLKGTVGLGNNAVMLGTATLLEPLTDCVISDLKIDGTDMDRSTTTTFKKGIDVLYTKNMRVFNVHIYKTPSTGFGPDCNINLLIDNCIFEECGTVGANPGYNGLGIGTGFYEDESGLISNCIAINNHNNGFLLEYVGGGFNSTGYQFVNCYAKGNKRGYRVSGARDSSFVSCYAIDSLNEGFYVQMFGAALAYPQNITIDGCNIWGNGGDGIYIKDQEAQQSGHIVRGNHIYNNTGYGILSGASHTHISNNVIYGNTKTGVLVHAYSTTPITGGQVTNNIVYNNATAGTAGAADGIRIYGELGSIDGLMVIGNSSNDFQATKTQLYGLVLKGTMTNAFVTQNDVRLNLTLPLLNQISPVDPSNQIFENVGPASPGVSTTVQTALDLKASLASPTFTGTVSGITKSMVGLGSVDNTADADKPVSTAQATADNLRLLKAGDTLSGNLTLADAVNIILNTGTGTKIGTATSQKLGFFNATPVVQQSATTDIGTVLSNLGLRAAGTAWTINTGGTVSFTAAQKSPGVARTGAVTLTTTSAKNNECDATSGAFTITLPSPTSQAGLTFHFIKTDASANAVLISGTGISQSLATQGKYVEARVNAAGTSWLVTSVN